MRCDEMDRWKKGKAKMEGQSWRREADSKELFAITVTEKNCGGEIGTHRSWFGLSEREMLQMS